MAYQIPTAPTGPQPMPQPQLRPDTAAGAKASTAGQATVTPEWAPQTAEAWNRWRRRVDAVRSVTGRTATVAGTAAAGTVIAHPGALAVALAGTAVLTAAGAGLLRLQMPHAGHQKATATVLYTVPGVSLAAVMAAGTAWGVPLLLAVAAWAAGIWLLRPARVARRMAVPPPPPAAETAGQGVWIAAHDDPAAAWWALNAAAEGRPAAGTVLEDVERTGESAMSATIRSTLAGEPVPEISIRRLSALMDIPEDQIAIGPVPGRGAGVRRLTVGTPDRLSGLDAATVWAERIAPKAMPGAVLTGVRVGKPGTTPATPATPATSTTIPADDAVDLTKEDA